MSTIRRSPSDRSWPGASWTLSETERPAGEHRLDDVRFCVVDVETTGLSPERDRIVELAVVRCDAHGSPVDEWHTLIDPAQDVEATDIHGVDDSMLEGAPTFAEVAPRLLQSLSGAVLVAHNARFDRGFVAAELQRVGLTMPLPHLCTMDLRRHAGLPAPSAHRLTWACWHFGVPIDAAHAALCDARATADLLGHYLSAARTAGARSVNDLARSPASAETCSAPLGTLAGAVPRVTTKTRAVPPRRPPRAYRALAADERRYQRALRTALADLRLDRHEIDALHGIVVEDELDPVQVQSIHRDVVRERVRALAASSASWEDVQQVHILGRLLAITPAWMRDRLDGVGPQPAVPEVRTTGEDDVVASPVTVTVCFTGEFLPMPLTRAEVQRLAEDAGMVVKPGVSRKVDLLVCADPHAGTTKLRRAAEIGTVIVAQDVFLQLAGVNGAPAGVLESVLRRVQDRRNREASPSPSSSSSSSGAAATSAPATRRSTLTRTEQVLWCGAGDHEWRRAATRGRPPRDCPDHRVSATDAPAP